MIIGLHFPFRFDIDSLHRDLAVARTSDWPRHYNEQDYGGNWSGIALRSSTGASEWLIAGPVPGQPFRDTPLLDRCPYFAEVLSAFQCPLRAVRLLSLAPQSFIREHSDYALGYDDGEIRVHVPIQTGPDVEFYVAGERLLLEEGHSYFLNVNLPHRVNNRGSFERIHLVIDAEVNDWVHNLFRRGLAEGWHVPRCARPPRNVDDFRLHVLKDPALMAQLQSIESGEEFTAKAMELGQTAGFVFHDGDIDAAIRCGHLKAPLPEAPGWVPVQAGEAVEWVYTGSRRFTDPFFEDTIRTAKHSPFAQWFRVEAPLEAAQTRPALEPSGFIFHVSRCGSTLVSQILASLPNHRVISEAPAIDDVLKSGQPLRPAVHALGEPLEGETRYFIKLDAWHNRHFRTIRAAFPNTPFVFVCRDPVEVMVSQLARPGRISIPGELERNDLNLTREAFCARVLEGIYEPALAMREDPNCLFIDYRELPGAFFGRIAPHFGLNLSNEDEARMRKAAGFDAKNPGMEFRPDSQRKQTSATPAIRELCERLLTPLYAAISSPSEASVPGPAASASQPDRPKK